MIKLYTEQLKFASLEKRATFTFNVADFCDVHLEFVTKKFEHSGIILSRQLPIGIIIKAFLKLLSSTNPQEVKNNIIWLTNWIVK